MPAFGPVVLKLQQHEEEAFGIEAKGVRTVRHCVAKACRVHVAQVA